MPAVVVVEIVARALTLKLLILALVVLAGSQRVHVAGIRMVALESLGAVRDRGQRGLGGFGDLEHGAPIQS